MSQVNQQNGAPTLPEALSGMFTACIECAAAREALERFLKAARDMAVAVPKDDEDGFSKIPIRKGDEGFWEIRCPCCHDTRYRPTNEGFGMLWLLAQWLQRAQPEWAKGLSEIPF